MFTKDGSPHTLFAVRYRIPIIIFSLAITIFMLLVIVVKGIESDTGASSILPADNEDYDYYSKVEKLFGSMEIVFIGVTHRDTIYNYRSLEAIDELTRFFESLPETDNDDIVSLVTVDTMWSEYGELIIEPLFADRDQLTDTALEDVKTMVRDNPLLKGKLVSEDEKSSFISAGFEWSEAGSQETLTRISRLTIGELERIKKKYPDSLFYLSGDVISEYKSTVYMAKDMMRLFPFAMIVVMIILLIILKDLRGMLIPILVTLFSIAWTFGLKSLISSPLTIAETAIPVMLISIGCADGVHIISEFLMLHRKGLCSEQAVTDTMKVLTTPVILTSLTTAIGFLSLTTAAGKSFKNMGIFLAFGVMCAMFLSLYLIPGILSFFGTSQPARHTIKTAGGATIHRFSSYFRSFLKIWGGFVYRSRIPIAIAAALIVIISVVGVIQVQVESDMLTYFHKKDPFRIDTEYIKKHLGGISEIYIIVEGKEENDLKEPEILQAMWKLQKYAESFEVVSQSRSLADFIRYMNFLIGEDPAYLRIPFVKEKITATRYRTGEDGTLIEEEEIREVEGKQQVANLLLLYELGGGALDEVVTPDYTTGCIKIRLQNNEDKKLRRLVEKLNDFIAAEFPGKAQTRFSNYYIYLITSELIIQSQISSIITSLCAIVIMLSLIFRSLIKGFIILIPTFCAIFLNFGLMWIFNVPLDIATSVIASIGIGVGVDYSIHYFTRFRHYYLKEHSCRKAIRKALEMNARGILSNAGAVGLGFFILIFSSFRAIFNMGWIIGLTMFTTAANALIILPALLAIFKPGFKTTKQRK